MNVGAIAGFIFNIIVLLLHIAILVWYILVFVRGKGPLVAAAAGSNTTNSFAGGNGGQPVIGGAAGFNAVQGTSAGADVSAGTDTAAMSRRFCSQCGTEAPKGTSFCAKCGARIEW